MQEQVASVWSKLWGFGFGVLGGRLNREFSSHNDDFINQLQISFNVRVIYVFKSRFSVSRNDLTDFYDFWQEEEC